MKKKVFIIIAVLIIILGTAGLIGHKYYVSKELYLDITKKVVVSLNDEVYNTAGVKKIINGKVVDKKEVVDTSKVGVQKITLTIKDYFKKNKKVSYEVEVKDTVAPVIEFKNKLTTEYDTKIDLLKGVVAKDDYDEEVEVSVVGEYDLKKAGEYNLQYVAKDSSGNETKEDFVLVVKEKVVEVPKVEEKPAKEDNSNNNQNTTPAVVNSDGSFTTSKGFHGETRNGVTYVNGILIANKTYSLPSTYNPGGLLGEFNDAFATMKSAAANEGISLNIGSGLRTYATQKSTYAYWVSKYGKAEADRISARPGHSEHQTGLAADIYGHDKTLYLDQAWINTSEGQWLNNNCYKYGFIIRYPKGKEGETGYSYEPWHIRYIGNVEIAQILYNGGNWISLESYLGITSKYSN